MAKMTDDDLQSLLSVAVDASKKAGEIILGNAGGAEVMECKANSRDLLTLVDPLCEKVRRPFALVLVQKMMQLYLPLNSIVTTHSTSITNTLFVDHTRNNPFSVSHP